MQEDTRERETERKRSKSNTMIIHSVGGDKMSRGETLLLKTWCKRRFNNNGMSLHSCYRIRTEQLSKFKL